MSKPIPPLEGLSQEAAREALHAWGPNEPPRPGRRNAVRIAAGTLREPMFILLMAASLLYLVLGDLGEGLLLLTGACASIGLVIFQEMRSERALTALRDLAQPQARVVRDGCLCLIPSRELVPGDLILVGEGDRIAADAAVIAGDALSVDESTLTGESAPVEKRLLRDNETIPSAPSVQIAPSPFLFAGTLVVRGQATCRVVHTGVRSVLGRIGRSLTEIDQGPTPLQKTAGRLVGLLGLFALLFCSIVAIAYGVLRGEWTDGVLAGVTVAIALIPEEFPMVLAVFLALGAWRLASHRVLVRRSAIIETLGSATILCVDKTGTLTENRMRVDRVWAQGHERSISQDPALDQSSVQLIHYAQLASSVRPVDPMDRALRQLPSKSPDTDALVATEPERTWPLRPSLLAVVQLWRLGDHRQIAAAKGAPESIFRLCRLSETQTVELQHVVERFAADGLRVLGVARCERDGEFPDAPEEMPFEFSGFVGFLDPLRTDASVALREARSAGIDVMMITGDHPATARAIAQAAGIATEHGILSGADIAQLPLPTLKETLRRVRVFARISPDQKLLIVEALKANGEIVAMTGDGVNDAPALEAAHIGIAMGRKGTDVAREAADLVLLDDSFASIVGGIRLGRRIFANLRKALIYITAIHLPIAGLALAPILLGMPQLLYPMHVVLLELAIDPICALAFEAERSSDSSMKRPPRRADEALFGAQQLGAAVLQGAAIFVGALGVYAWSLSSIDAAQSRGAAFIALVIANLTLALANAAGTEGRILDAQRTIYWSLAAAVLALLALSILTPALSQVFNMALPAPPQLIGALSVGLLSGAGPWLCLRLLSGYRRWQAHPAPMTEN